MMEKMSRTLGVKRVEVKGKKFTAVNNDCILEFENLPENTFDLLHTSIPFGNHYEYSASYNDFGFNPDTEAFLEQMDYLSPNLLRTLKPGRVFACHVKDRVLFGNTTGDGFPTMEPFHALCIEHYMKHGFRYFGMITVITDVVRENNQTYRLGWTEQCKDGTKMGVGCPEYVLLFRKLPSNTSNAYADIPVMKSKEEYTRAQWQIDAHGFWRTSGDRFLTKAELERIPVNRLQQAYLKYSRDTVYNYQEHVELAKKLDENGKLPAAFMVVAPGSWSNNVWDDILRFKTLNAKQSQKRLQNHVCPLQIDIVERIINRYSNPGELVGDPFGGLMTVPKLALDLGRKGWGCELSTDYFRDGIGYLQVADADIKVPSLFDFFGDEEGCR
jgi:DNA modification methylase